MIRIPLTRPLVLSLLLLAHGGGQTIHPPQPGLAEEIRQARPLVVEKLMKGPESVWDQFVFWAPNRDGATWDVFFIYSPNYMGPHEVFILDTGTGELKRQTIERGFMFHLIDRVMIDGKLYLKPHVQGRDGESIFIYDPDANELIHGGRPLGPNMENFGGKWVYEEGLLHGFGRLRGGAGEPDRYAAYRIDPSSLEGETFPPIGEVHENHDWIYTSLHKDGDWLYAKVGKAPWRLWGYDMAAGAGRMLVETEVFEGDHRTIRVRPLEAPGGFLVEVDRPVGGGGGFYWLKDGRLTAKEGDVPPWSEQPATFPRNREILPFPKPELQRTPPDAAGNVVVTWRPAGGESAEWQRVEFPVIRHPQPIRRMVALPDRRLFALAESYGQAVMLDIDANERMPLGQTMSVYSMASQGSMVYMSGYSGAQIWKYDTTLPWNVRSQPVDLGNGASEGDGVGDILAEGSNPRQVAKLQQETRMQNPWGGTVIGGDGLVYAAGWIIRVGNGGALGWWDPKTGESGGLTYPFSAYPIYWMCGVGDGETPNRYLAISTKTTKDDNNPDFTPDQGKVFVYDTQSRRIVSEMVPTPLGFHGPVVEAAAGVVMGFSRDPEGDGGLLWANDVASGEPLWRRSVPAAPVTNFASMRRHAGTILHPGPDGKVWTFFDKVLVRIDPGNGEAEVVGTLGERPIGQLAFLEGKVYLAGDVSLLRIVLDE
jgi:hypothetical protein